MDMEITFSGGQSVVALYKGFEIVTDQREKDGGQGSAPAPFDLFLASLGTCAGYYVLNFCQTRNLSVDGIKLLQRWQRDPETKLIRTLQQDIMLPEDFPKKYLSAVVRAAQLCSVKKHLETPPEVTIRAIRSDE